MEQELGATMAKKKCSECGQVKEITEFRTRTGAPDGRRGQCKECMNRIERITREEREAKQLGDPA